MPMPHRFAASANSRSTSPRPPRQLRLRATEYSVKLLGQSAKPPSWCAVRQISFMPIAAALAIHSSASSSVGAKMMGSRHGQ